MLLPYFAAAEKKTNTIILSNLSPYLLWQLARHMDMTWFVMVLINDCEKEGVGIQPSMKTENKLPHSVLLLCQIVFVVEI